MNTESAQAYQNILDEMRLVYLHDQRPWMIGFSGGKDSTLLCQLVFEMLQTLQPFERTKKVYIVTSDTGVENPIIRSYMHRMSAAINEASEAQRLHVEAHIIYPDPRQSFWSMVIGRGYPTPEPPGFRWCTERLKIAPSNKFTYETIQKNGEIVILLGVRKAESVSRAKAITSREIEGKILSPHPSIPQAYVYRPLSDIKNENVWEYLLRGDGKSAWGTDNHYLFNLYQGEPMGEEQSVVGEVDKDRIPVTGHSRFGCWCCTMVKEDKSLKNFIDHGAKELRPLRDFRDWLVSIRDNPDARDKKRRNGTVYLMPDGTYGLGPFTMEKRQEIPSRLLALEEETGFELISLDELKEIDRLWDLEGDLSRRALVDLYYQAKGKRLPWDAVKRAKYSEEELSLIRRLADRYDVPFDLMSQLMTTVDNTKFFTRSSVTIKEVERLINQGWLHFEYIRGELPGENQPDRRL